LGDRRKVISTHSKGDRILSMAAGAGAIAVLLLGDRIEAFNGDGALAQHQSYSETPPQMAIAP
jgi:hypothetical protein